MILRSVPVGEVTEGNAIPPVPLMTRPGQQVGPCSFTSFSSILHVAGGLALYRRSMQCKYCESDLPRLVAGVVGVVGVVGQCEKGCPMVRV